MNIRLALADDIKGISEIVDQTELFPSDMLQEMMKGFLSQETSEEVWLTCDTEGAVSGFCYARQEQLTSGTWNLLAIAVSPSSQRNSVGTLIVQELENILRERGNRILIVDTSGAQEFAGARRFYLKNGYEEEARIRDFWDAGDDKVTFRKAL